MGQRIKWFDNIRRIGEKESAREVLETQDQRRDKSM